MPWVARRLRGAKVWVSCDEKGEPLAGADERVDVLYKKGGKRYRAGVRNLLPDDGKDGEPAVLSDAEAQPGEPAAPASAASPVAGAPAGATPGAAASKTAASKTAASKTAAAAPQHAAGAIHVYTDGACTGNPGPMGIGVVILGWAPPDAPPATAIPRRELSEYLGVGTNNIAELTAILRGLTPLPRAQPVVVYSDSAYAIGLLTQNWKAKANQDLVAELRGVLREFATVRFVKVPGHSGVPENERCDELARAAILRRSR